ncbi:MAG: DnaJ domain-containing protein [Bdellovibrionota bacterium]
MMKFIILFLIIYLLISHLQDQNRKKKRIYNPIIHGDPYDVLGVSPEASDEEVKAAYREQSRKNHPDLVSHMSIDFQKLAESKLKQINAAYDVIKKQRGL